jgi:hypothetical protein
MRAISEITAGASSSDRRLFKAALWLIVADAVFLWWWSACVDPSR